MAGSKFQYDESGGTFFYFLLSFLALVVIPCTYYFYPSDTDTRNEDQSLENDKHKKKCHCEHCVHKSNLLKKKEPWKKTKNRVIKFLLLLGWVALFATAYKCTQLQHDYVNWDPFEILQIDPGASSKEIKKAYHKLSLIYHPDKETGDEKMFLMITKAYAALTDDEARKNWELYGNPDGPGATSFGIALPSWIVEKENSLWVLGVYALVFMVALPTVVGIWWYNSVKYGGDEVLLDTTQLYYYFIHKNPHMILKRVIMIIAASLEFDKAHNSEIVERISDNHEVPQLMRDLPNLNEKNKERPLCFSYSIKARALIFAHLSRMKLPQETLEVDKNIVIKKSPALIHEFIQCVSQMTMLALAGRISRSPTLDTLESAMKLCPAIIQAVWDSKSPFLQLPHITEDMLRYFTVKKSKQYVRSMTQLATMNNQDRRSMLSKLTDEQYEDVMAVLGNMPHLEADVKTEVLDDEESGNITAGSIVTVTVTLTRRPMSSLFVVTDAPKVVATKVVTGEHLNGDANLEKENQLPVWDKKGKVSKKLKKQKSQQRKLRVQEKKEEKEKQRKEDEERRALISTEDNEGINGQENQQQSDIESSSDHESEKEQEVHSGTESDDEADMHDLVEEDKESISDSGDDDAQDLNDDDDEAWERFQKKQNKKANDSLETKAKMSHSVHCPFFTDDKQEFWWIYLSDHKKRALTTIPVLLTNLVDTESIDLKLTAPPKPGSYQYSVVIRSDSYIDFDIIKTIKLDVKEAKIIKEHPQWDISDVEEDEEQDEESAVEDSDLLDETEEESQASEDDD